MVHGYGWNQPCKKGLKNYSSLPYTFLTSKTSTKKRRKMSKEAASNWMTPRWSRNWLLTVYLSASEWVRLQRAAENLDLYLYMKCFLGIIPAITFPHQVPPSFWLTSKSSRLFFLSEIPTLLCRMSVHLVTGCLSLIGKCCIPISETRGVIYAFFCIKRPPVCSTCKGRTKQIPTNICFPFSSYCHKKRSDWNETT